MDILHFLNHSAVTEPLRADFRDFLRTGRPTPLIAFDIRYPTVKVERTLTKILESFPTLPIERIEIAGTSGCEFFRGTALVETGAGTQRVQFEWNCRWKAEQLGWSDYFGFPDQARAAREHGYDCFVRWEEEALGASTAA